MPTGGVPCCPVPQPARMTAVRLHTSKPKHTFFRRTKMATWRKKLFIVMTRNAQSAATFFRLPPNRVVELGAQIQL